MSYLICWIPIAQVTQTLDSPLPSHETVLSCLGDIDINEWAAGWLQIKSRMGGNAQSALVRYMQGEGST